MPTFSTSHDTPFTPADRTLSAGVEKARKAFLAALVEWEAACKKYPKDYGQAADALTAIAVVRAATDDVSAIALEAK